MEVTSRDTVLLRNTQPIYVHKSLKSRILELRF